MKRRLISLLLAAVTVLTLLPSGAFAADTADSFRDVKQGDWCYDAVQYVCANGFFNGTSRTAFSPNDTMTRGMFVTVLGRIAGVDTAQYQGRSNFIDVPEDAYFAPYVAWASRHGITAGTGEGRFSPYAYINRQQMASFFLRYFEAFGVDYGTGADIAAAPADIDSVSPYAREAVLKLWQEGLLNGDGVNFNPAGNATRAQTAMVCYRVDRAVETWYREPGVPSDRVKVEPPAAAPATPVAPVTPVEPAAPVESGGFSGRRYVRFYDGDRLIETIPGYWGQPLGRVPSVEKSSKAGAVLTGYYTDPACTRPFYADDPVTGSINVYARYEDVEATEEALTPASFARMDQDPYVTFRIRRVSGGVEPRDAAVLTVKDGSGPVDLTVTPVRPPAPEPPVDPVDPSDPIDPSDPADPDFPDGSETMICTVAADPKFNEGCSYELTLAEGWIFVDEETGEDRPETVRTAAFSIAMEEVHNLRMNEAVTFIEDTNDFTAGDLTFEIGGTVYDALTNSAVSELGADGTGTFIYDGGVSSGDILCIYVGRRPDRRRTGSEAKEPAAYVKVQSVSGDIVTFQALEKEDQGLLYEIPDNFPFRVDVLPEGGGTVSIDAMDTELYSIMANMPDQVDAAVLSHAEGKLGAGDFVTFHTGEITGTGDLRFGEVIAVNGGVITYKPATREDILHSMDLYDRIDTTGDDLLTEENRARLEEQLGEQAEQSGFAEEAAYLLADLVTRTEGFRNSAAVQQYLLDGAGGRSFSQVRSGGLDGSFSLVNRPRIRVQLHGRGARFGGVQMKITVSARLRVPLGDDIEAFLGDYLAIDVEGSFTEEFTVVPTVKGYATYDHILFIPVLNGVHVDANLDVKNYTAFSFDAEVYGTDAFGVVEGEVEHVSSQLEELTKAAAEESYQKSLEELLERYQELVGREPGWITLLEEKVFSSESCFYGVCFGSQGTFVIRADINLALGSSMEYEAGKRYIFWFEVGLYSPTAGSSTMDLLDERFAFQFYVMGKITLRMGIRLKIYVGIGTGDLASVGITTELGPYVRLYGFFVYTCSRYRPKNSSLTTAREQMDGAVGLEIGLYFTLGVEAKALAIFTYSHDFLDREFPLFHAGAQEVYYGCAYRPEPDEAVYVASESSDPGNVVMTIPETLLEMDYMALQNGRRGSRALAPDNYYLSVSNSNFSLEKTGDNKLKVHVNVPENVHLLRCTLTVTYKGKLPLSRYDMTTAIPLIWTDLSTRQMKEYFTATVRVGNNLDGYDTVWRQKVLRGEEFDLPVGEKLMALAHWNDYRYTEGTGYGSQNTVSLGIAEDTVYDYNVRVRTYSVTVIGIEGGGPASRTYTARYGEAFDFSDLESTGRRGPSYFTKFAGLETNLDTTVGTDEETGQVFTEPLDITRPIDRRLAQALSRGNVRVRARYVDDSVTAVYSFTGIDHEDVTSTTGRGMEPGITPVYAAVAEAAQNLNLDDLEITGITPEHGPISAAQHYMVQCLALSGDRADVILDVNHDGIAGDAVDKLVGSVLANLPQPERTGYTFQGWADESGRTVTSIVVPWAGATLTAQWTPNHYTLTFNGNGGEMDGQGRVDKDVVFDSTYGQLPEPRRTGYRFFGWWTEPGFEANGPGLADDVHDGVQVTEDTPVDHTENRTLYAHWKPLMDLRNNTGGGDLFAVSTRTETYDRNTTYTVDDLTAYYSQIPDLCDEEDNPIPADSFNFELKPRIAGGISTGEAHDAGGYILEITRNADELYSSYTEIHDILEIEKADWVTAIWQAGDFPLEIEGHDGGITNWVTVNYPTADGDLPGEITSGMRFRIWREYKDIFFPEKNETHDFGGHLEDNGSGSRVEIYLKFPDGASSRNYNLPNEVLIYNGGIRNLLGKDPNKITRVP